MTELSHEQTEATDKPLETTAPDTSTTAAPAPDKATEQPKGGESAAPKTALEAAKRVMAKEEKAASDAKPQDGKPPESKPDEAKVEVEDDDAKLPFKDDPRWKKMSSENRILKVAREKDAAAIKELEPKAKVHDELHGWLTERNIGRDDFSTGLSIIDAVRNDPTKAYELLKPVMTHLETLVGARLPADLAAQVEAGSVTQEIAQELARTRGKAAITEGRLQTTEDRAQRDAEARRAGEFEQQTQTVVTALNTCESAWMKSDPDAAKLLPIVQNNVMVLGDRNPPRNAEDARALFDAALKAAKDQARAFGYRAPAPKDGILPAGGASTTTASPVPKSSLDAAMAALRPSV